MKSDNNIRWLASKVSESGTEPVLPFSDLPTSYVMPICNYVMQGFMLNQKFLTAVIENDLQGACIHADAYDREHLFEVVRWVQNFMPSLMQGEKGIVERWCAAMRPLIDAKIEDFEEKLRKDGLVL